MTTVPILASQTVTRRCAIAASITLAALAITGLSPAPLLMSITVLLAMAVIVAVADSLLRKRRVPRKRTEPDLILHQLSTRHDQDESTTRLTVTLEDTSTTTVDDEALDDLFHNAAAPIRWVNANGTILRANQAELDMLGYPAAEYIGCNIGEFLTDPDQARAILDSLARGETLRDFPARLRRHDGEIEEVLISAKASPAKRGVSHSLHFTRVVIINEQEHESTALLAAIVAASDDAIISKSLDGIVRSWNAGAERILGYSEAEMIGRPIYTIIPPELHDEEKTILAKLRAGERVEHFETVRLTRDHRRVELSLTVSPIFDGRGRVIGASKVARDISAHKKAERALKASEERFRLMADSAPVLIWMADTDGNATWFNRRWLDFTGRSMDEESGRGWIIGLHPDDRQHVLENYKRYTAAGEHYILEHRLRRADGDYRWILVNALPLQAGDDFNGYIGSCVDITGRKQAEEALRLEDRRKTEFIATLAHELRNPLAPIRNALEIIKTTDYEPELWRHSHNIIERQLVHMVRLVDDLLNISRINQDKLALRTEQVELSQLIEQAVETVQSLAQEYSHTLRVQGAPEPITLQADPVRLTQVLSNLLSNACKFTPPGGEISLTVSQLDGDVSIAIQDTGIGIAPDEIHSIFDLFQQSGNGRDRSIGGLGIGLTLAKRLVEMHGGSISVSSPGLGKGTTFTVDLPVAASPTDVSPPQQTHALDPGSQRILVVDDNLDSAETLALLLRLEGHEVRLAYDGEEALNEAESFAPELVLLDLGLPKLDGIEVCRRIRAQPWGQNMTIIALTGWGQEEDRKKSEQAGFDEHLVKPVSREVLTEALFRHARRSLYRRS